MTNTSDSEDKSDEVHPPTWLGWAVRFVSVAVFAAMVGLIVYKVASEDQPIAFDTKVITQDIRQEGDQFFIPVEVSNGGSRTAKRVQMELDVGGETSEIEIDMIGASEKTRFVLIRPARFETVKHSLLAYETP